MSDLNIRSRAMTAGVERTPNRAMLRAVGFTDQDFDKPIVGIASAGSDVTPCNVHLDGLADRRGRECAPAAACPCATTPSWSPTARRWATRA